MLLLGMVSNLPPRVDYRAFPDFYYTVAGVESSFGGCLNEVNMRPLKLVIMDVVGNFAK